LRGIFRSKMGEVSGGKRKKHEEPHDLYSLTNITGMIKSRQMRKVVGHVREENCIKSFDR